MSGAISKFVGKAFNVKSTNSGVISEELLTTRRE